MGHIKRNMEPDFVCFVLGKSFSGALESFAEDFYQPRRGGGHSNSFSSVFP